MLNLIFQMSLKDLRLDKSFHKLSSTSFKPVTLLCEEDTISLRAQTSAQEAFPNLEDKALPGLDFE